MPSPWLFARTSGLYCRVFVPADLRPHLGQRFLVVHMDARFGSPECARVELRAELVSSMMQGVIGLPPGPTMIAQHSAYLASWLQALKNDKTEIFRAAADAQKICDYVSNLAAKAEPRAVRNTACDSDAILITMAQARRVTL